MIESRDLYWAAYELEQQASSASGPGRPIEAFYRIAAHCLYYGVHHEVCRLAEGAGVAIEPNRRHIQMINWLRERDRRAGNDLNRLRKRRNEADYELYGSWSHAQVQEAWALTRRIRRDTGLRTAALQLPPPLR